MGGVLTLLAAAQLDIPRIVLCAPATHVRRPLFWLAPLLGVFVPKRERPAFEPQSDHPEERELEGQYYRFTWYRPAGRLYRLQRSARRRLSQVRAETLIIVSESDETVPPSVAPYIEERISSETKKSVRLRESGHIVVNDVDREYVAGEIASWVERSP
jgi:carboxylesterase